MAEGKGPSNADLTAYLDGEMAREAREELAAQLTRDLLLRDRLAWLARGERPFRAAFDALLDHAPADRLEGMLATVLQTAPVRTRASGGRRAWPIAAAAGILMFLAGVAADRFSLFGETEDWRDTVAEYLTLYSADTLAAVPDDPSFRAAELANVGKRLGLYLSPERIALPGLALKRAQLYRLNNAPLAQISYLDAEVGPVSLCIIAMPEAARGFTTERRRGQNMIYWSQGGRTFMLVSAMPVPRLRALAEALAGRLTS